MSTGRRVPHPGRDLTLRQQPRQQRNVTFVFPDPSVVPHPAIQSNRRTTHPGAGLYTERPGKHAHGKCEKQGTCHRRRSSGSNDSGRSSGHHDLQCPICADLLMVPVKTTCGHLFCFFCLFHHAIELCPLCRAPISVIGGDFAFDAFAELSVNVYADEAKRRRRWKHAMARFSRFMSSPHPGGGGGAVVAGHEDDNKRQLRALATRMLSEVLQHAPPSTDRNNTVDATEAISRHEHCVRARWVGVTGGGAAAAALGGGSSEHPTAGVVSEQCEMYFVNGFMRRRAPSLLLVTEDDGSDDVDDGDRLDAVPRAAARKRSSAVPRCVGKPPQHSVGHRDAKNVLPAAVERRATNGEDAPPQWRALLAARVAAHNTTHPHQAQRQRLPVLVDLDSEESGHQDSSLVRFNPKLAPLVVAHDPDNGDELCIVDDDDDMEGDERCDDDLHHHAAVPYIHAQRSGAAASSTFPSGSGVIRAAGHRVPTHTKQAYATQLPSPAQLVRLPQPQRVMSADTRLQSDLRMQLKALSAAASQRHTQKHGKR